MSGGKKTKSVVPSASQAFYEGAGYELYKQGQILSHLGRLGRGVASTVTSAPRYLKRATEAQFTFKGIDPETKIAGRFTRATDAADAFTKAKHAKKIQKWQAAGKKEKVQRFLESKRGKSTKAVEKMRKKPGKKNGFEITGRGEIYHKPPRFDASGEDQRVYGLPRMAVEALRPGAWKEGFQAAYSLPPGSKASGVRGLAARVGQGIKEDPALWALPALDVVGAESPEDYRDIGLVTLPAAVLGGVGSRLGGKKYAGFLPQIGAYEAATYLMKKNPMVHRPGGLTSAEIQRLATLYQTTPQEVVRVFKEHGL